MRLETARRFARSLPETTEQPHFEKSSFRVKGKTFATVPADSTRVRESRRVMEACGFRYVRTFHLQWVEPIEGTEFGDVAYELVRSDYIAR